MRLYLRVVGRGDKQRVELGQGVILGRVSPVLKQLRFDRRVAPQQASIRRTPRGELVVADLGSEHGTWINGRRIVDTTPLSAGDLLRVGDMTLELVIEQEASGRGGGGGRPEEQPTALDDQVGHAVPAPEDLPRTEHLLATEGRTAAGRPTRQPVDSPRIGSIAEALATSLGHGEQVLAAVPCSLAGAVQRLPVVVDQYDKHGAIRAKHGAAPTALAGSYPDQPPPNAKLHLVVTDRRVLACRTRWRLSGRRGPVLSVREIPWQGPRESRA